MVQTAEQLYYKMFEMLESATRNVERVYETGYKNGVRDSGYEKGFDEGKKTEHDTFWDAFQNANRTTWSTAFQHASWNDITFYPKNDLIISGEAASLFRYCDITDLAGRLKECGVTLDTSECTYMNCGFGDSKRLTTVPMLDLSKCTSSGATTGLFSGCTSLETIRKLIVNENVMFPNSFRNCRLLANITFVGVIGQNIDFTSCTKLTRESICSILNALTEDPDIAHGKTLTLSRTAVDNAFRGGYVWNKELGTDVWDDTIPGSESSEWHAYIAPKEVSGWTITLV